MSLTKWVQIPHGDDGLLRFFDYLSARLRKPGGLLLLEPHEHESYKRITKALPPHMQSTIRDLKIKPSDFDRLLQERGIIRIREFWPEGHGHSRALLLYERTKE